MKRPMIRRATGPTSSDPTLNRTTPQNRDQYQAETFSTSAITQIKDSGAHNFVRNGLNIQMSCVRSFDKEKIANIFPNNRVPALCHETESLGALITCDADRCSLFPLPGQSLCPGERYHHFLIRVHNKEMLASVSLDIRSVTRPTAADFTRDVQFEAAWQVYNTQVEKAKLELRHALRRIVAEHAGKQDVPIFRQPKETHDLYDTPRVQPVARPVKKGFRLGSR